MAANQIKSKIKEEVLSIRKSPLAEAGHIETFDLEYHAQNAAMEIALTQTSKGFFYNSRNFLKLPGLFMSKQTWSRACTAKGQVPPGCVMLGINQHSSRDNAVSWCGTALTKNTFAISRAGTEFEFTTSEGSKEAILLVDQAVFDALLEEDSIHISYKERVLNLPPDKWLDFRNSLSSIIDEYCNQPALLENRANLETDQSAIQELIVRSLDTKDIHSGSVFFSSSTVKDALNILATMKAPITIRKLASTLNVTQRALEIGFRKHVGMTPSLYARRLRLNRAYRELSAASQGEVRVSDIAAKWGFHHPGRFSVEYHNMFGEKPSSTLSKVDGYRSNTILRPSG